MVNSSYLMLWIVQLELTILESSDNPIRKFVLLLASLDPLHLKFRKAKMKIQIHHNFQHIYLFQRDQKSS